MKHMIISKYPQIPLTNPNDPDGFLAYEIYFPETFSEKAQRIVGYFKYASFLFLYKGLFVLTDESLNLNEPRWSGKSLEELEAWMEGLCDEYDAHYEDYPGWISIYDPNEWDWD